MSNLKSKIDLKGFDLVAMKLEGWNLLNQVNEDIGISGCEITESDEYHRWRQIFWGLVELGSPRVNKLHEDVINKIDKVMGYSFD